MRTRAILPRLLVVSALVAITGAVLAPSAATAAPSIGSDTGSQQYGTGERSSIIGTPTTTAAEAAGMAKKDAAAKALYTHKGLMTTAAAGGISPLVSCPDGDCTNLALAVQQHAQINSYYCGPATIQEVVGLYHSVSQSTAAAKMGTTTDGTPWYDGSKYPMEYALDYYLRPDGAEYYHVGLSGSPTSTEKSSYKSRLYSDIRNGWAFAGNAWEVVGGLHLAGHPNTQIFHWFAITGYTSSGTNTTYADSVHGATSISWSGSVPAFSTMSSNTIATIMGGRGYIW